MIEEFKRVRQAYHRQQEAVADTLVEGLCLAYKEITGGLPNDRLREELYKAVYYNR